MALKGCSHNQSYGRSLFELRIVLLGGRNSGKSFVGNTILNREEFVLQERTTCLKREAEIQGRNVIVVDTPGWWCDFSSRETPKLVRREIKRSVSLSLPGPHVFLLVIKTDSLFIEKRRRAVEEHLKLLCDTVWSHTLVLFTKGRNSFEDYVKASGKPLQWLLGKCRGIFHILDLQKTHSATQLMELMGEIEKLVEGNERVHFEIDARTLQEIEESKREVEVKAHQRLIRIENKRASIKLHACQLQNFRLVLLGAKGSGKSSTGNSILAAGCDLPFTTKKRTARCMVKTCTVAGRQLTVVDTPGWWMNYFTQDSTAFDKQEIVNSAYLCPPGPHAFLLVVRVDRSFTEIYRRAAEEHLELVGHDIWRHTILLFTFGDWLGDTTIEHHIESEGEALQWLVERCGDRYQVLNNKKLGDGFQITKLLEKIEGMMAETSMNHFEIGTRIVEDFERRKLEEVNRLKLRCQNMLRKKQRLSTFKEHVSLPCIIRLILLGAKHSGKTSAARCILGKDGEESHNQKPLRGSITINNTNFKVVDTPGWTTKYPDSESSREFLNDSETCVLLLAVNASSSFTSQNFKAAQSHLEALDGEAWSRTIVLFTNGDWLGDVSVEQYIESEGDALQMLVEKCGHRYHVFKSKIKDDGTQVVELMEKIEEMLLEQMLNSDVNKESIEQILELPLGKITATSRTKYAFGNTRFLGETGNSEHSTPVTFGDLTMTNTDSSLSQNHNQALACTGIQLSNRNLSCRNKRQRLVVVLNVPEWRWQNEPLIGANRTETHELQTVRTELQRVRLSKWPCLMYQRCTPNTGQTAKQRAFLEYIQSGSLQELIDQWGDSNIKELEAFIDSYFEMVWQENIQEAKAEESCNTSPMNCEISGITETGLKYLASIDKKLSKLEILEDVQNDLKELKQNLKDFSLLYQELKDSIKEPCLSS